MDKLKPRIDAHQRSREVWNSDETIATVWKCPTCGREESPLKAEPICCGIQTLASTMPRRVKPPNWGVP